LPRGLTLLVNNRVAPPGLTWPNTGCAGPLHRPSPSPTARSLGFAVGHGPFGIHVGVCLSRFHHGADAPRSPGLRPTFASAAPRGQHSVGERPASAGWWRRPTHKRSASPATCHAVRRRWSTTREVRSCRAGARVWASDTCLGPQGKTAVAPYSRLAARGLGFAVGYGPFGIDVGVCLSRFHHGADAPRSPGLRPTFASAARCRQHSVGERPASAGWWRRPTRERFASPATCHAARPSWSSPRRPTRAVTRPNPAKRSLRHASIPANTGTDSTHGTQFGLCRWTRAVWDPRGGLSVALPPWG